MTEPDYKALAERLTRWAHEMRGVIGETAMTQHGALQLRTLDEAAAAIAALLKERDEARANERAAVAWFVQYFLNAGMSKSEAKNAAAQLLRSAREQVAAIRATPE